MKSESAEEAAGPPIPTKGSTGEAALKCLRPEVAASTAPLNFTGVGRPGQSGETLQPARSRARGRSTSLQLKECAQRETTQRTPSPAASSRIPTRQWGTPSHQRAMVRGEGNQSNRGGGRDQGMATSSPAPHHLSNEAPDPSIRRTTWERGVRERSPPSTELGALRRRSCHRPPPHTSSRRGAGEASTSNWGCGSTRKRRLLPADLPRLPYMSERDPDPSTSVQLAGRCRINQSNPATLPVSTFSKSAAALTAPQRMSAGRGNSDPPRQLHSHGRSSE